MAPEHDELEEILQRLSQHCENVERKGDDLTGFIFAENNSRAIEISMNEEGKWWMEFWEAKDDEYGSPLKELTVAELDHAVDHLIQWLER
ncbi:MAG: hypothetical protein Tsb009_30740 [Planctomycetaceae bacterium]